MTNLPPRATFFPYTTLFRSACSRLPAGAAGARLPRLLCRQGGAEPRAARAASRGGLRRSEEHTSELQSHLNLVCRLLLEKNNQKVVEFCVCLAPLQTASGIA